MNLLLEQSDNRAKTLLCYRKTRKKVDLTIYVKFDRFYSVNKCTIYYVLIVVYWPANNDWHL